MTAPRSPTTAAAPPTRRYRVGCYLFFALCAFCVSVMSRVLMSALDWPERIAEPLGLVALLATFLALRDMTAVPLESCR